MTFLEELLSKVNQHETKIGHDTNWLIEMYGGNIIIPTAFEPDASTYRDDYYYNAIDNKLYKKRIIAKKNGTVIACWI